jgi:hypothetical protein
MRQRIELWKHIFDTDDNAISKALSGLAWNFAAFSCVVEMVRAAPDEGSGKRLNGMILDMIASGYWSNTMQGVRRLAEREAINGPRGVCSLGGLIQDTRAARGGLARKVFVEEIAGLPYNYEVVRDQYWQYIFRQPTGVAHWIPKEYDYEPSEQRHALFDWLSGTSPGTSTPDDLIREEVFDALEQRLARLEGVVEHVNVEIAHAATEASRHGRVLDRWGLGDAKTALKELVQIAELIGNWFCYSGIGTVLPTPQFSQFEHLDQPLFAGDMARLQEVWDAIDAEVSEWHNVEPSALLSQEIGR